MKLPELKPDSYEKEKCLACGETVEVPRFTHSMFGGGKEEGKFLGDVKHVSDFKKKRKVEVRTMTWGPYGHGHWHTDLEVEENRLVVVLHDPPYVKEPTVYEVSPWGNHGPDRKTYVTVGAEFMNRTEALRAALKKYQDELGCERYYLVSSYANDMSKRTVAETLRRIRRESREGD